VTYIIVTELIKENENSHSIDFAPESAIINAEDDQLQHDNNAPNPRIRLPVDEAPLLLRVKQTLNQIGNPHDRSQLKSQTMKSGPNSKELDFQDHHATNKQELNFTSKIIIHESLTFLRSIHELLSIADLELIDTLLDLTILEEGTPSSKLQTKDGDKPKQ